MMNEIDGSSNGSLGPWHENMRTSNWRSTSFIVRDLSPVMLSYVRECTNDMLMLAARGINGGTPVSETEGP